MNEVNVPTVPTGLKFTWKGKSISFQWAGNPHDKKIIVACAITAGYISVSARQPERDQFFAAFTCALAGVDGEAKLNSVLQSTGKLSAKSGKDGAISFSLPAKLSSTSPATVLAREALARAIARVAKQTAPFEAALSALK